MNSPSGKPRDPEDAKIHQLHQFLHQCRTTVTSLHHNMATAWQEKFGNSGLHETNPIWLLGERFEISAFVSFQRAWDSIQRMTYRRDFAPMYRLVIRDPPK